MSARAACEAADKARAKEEKQRQDAARREADRVKREAALAEREAKREAALAKREAALAKREEKMNALLWVQCNWSPPPLIRPPRHGLRCGTLNYLGARACRQRPSADRGVRAHLFAHD